MGKPTCVKRARVCCCVEDVEDESCEEAGDAVGLYDEDAGADNYQKRARSYRIACINKSFYRTRSTCLGFARVELSACCWVDCGLLSKKQHAVDDDR